MSSGGVGQLYTQRWKRQRFSTSIVRHVQEEVTIIDSNGELDAEVVVSQIQDFVAAWIEVHGSLL